MRITDKFVFFFTAKDFLSQWHNALFQDRGLTFKTAEHYMMFQKAVMFELPGKTPQEVLAFLQQDSDAYRSGKKRSLHIANEILNAPSPKEVKALGRKVQNFDQTRWEKSIKAILYKGNKLKMTQNPALLKEFLTFGNRSLVEASPYDKIYGIGMSEDNPNALYPERWKGQNILGQVLTKLCHDMQKEAHSTFTM